MTFSEFQKAIRSKMMPSGDELAKLAQEKFAINRRKVKANFNRHLDRLLSLEFKIYKDYEKECSKTIIDEAMRKRLLTNLETFSETFVRNYDKLWEFFLSISQSRKTRAGGSFEKHVKYLFELLEYPFERQSVLNGRVDYVIPSVNAFKRNRTSCVVISVKRTLRERWRQVVGELTSTNAGKIYILTADENVSYTKVEEMKNHNVNLVVWDQYKAEKFREHYNVLGFTQFVKVDLPSSKRLWQQLL
ncbi:MAG: type II restriction endonuclease [Candidatus Zixiibacteriota bacterium]